MTAYAKLFCELLGHRHTLLFQSVTLVRFERRTVSYLRCSRCGDTVKRVETASGKIIVEELRC